MDASGFYPHLSDNFHGRFNTECVRCSIFVHLLSIPVKQCSRRGLGNEVVGNDAAELHCLAVLHWGCELCFTGGIGGGFEEDRLA